MTDKSLSHYDLLGPLGAGGMGEVYRARDRRLDREVAIKVLPPGLAADPERLARFEREARVLASLNHPNVGSIYGLDRDGDTTFLALELVEGDDLSERLLGGPLPVGEALGLARQIARALEAAHERNIVHRDLKPSNVKVTHTGTAKVLDFGLAKVRESTATQSQEEHRQASDRSPTLALGHTGDGVILGTAAYMSPEQARGLDIDARSDIWAFGCVLYEMLAGRPAFGRDTVSDTLVAILEREPDFSALPVATPRSIRRLLGRCLNKDLDRRLHHIADARLVIEDALEVDESDPVTSTGQRAGFGAAAVAAAIVGGLVLGYVAHALVGGSGADVARGTRIDEVARITHDPGLSEWPTWSPDGQLLAFTSNRGGDFDVYVRRVEGGQEVNVTEAAGDDFQPSFSPDGDWIAFVSTRSGGGLVKIGATFGMEFRTFGGDVWVVPALGGRARRIGERGNAPAWRPDGTAVAYVSGREDHRSIREATLDGNTVDLLPESDSSWEIVRVHYSPDGRWMTFDSVNADAIMIMPAEGGEPRMLLPGLSHVWDPAGDRIHFLTRDPRGGTRLQSVEVDSRAGALAGEPVTVGLMTGLLRDLTMAADGRTFAAVEVEGSLNLTLLPLNPSGDGPGGPEMEVSPGQVIDRYPRFSPDGTTVAFSSNRLGIEEVWLLDRVSGDYERLELPGADLGVNLPYFSPDGREIFVTRSFDDGTRALWRAALDGSGTREMIPPTPDNLQGSPPSPDGRYLLYSQLAGEFTQLFTLDLESGEATQLTASEGDKSSGEWSPDGTTIIYHSNATGAVQIWGLDRVSGAERRITSSDERIRHAFFSPDGRWIYYQPNHLNVYRIPAAGGEATAVTRFPESGLFLEEPALSPDGRWLAYCRSNGGSSIWILRTSDEPAS